MKYRDLLDSYESVNKFSETVSLKSVICDIKNIDELQKVTVPRFVADVIEGAREKSPELEDALYYTWGNGSKEFTEWYKKKSNRYRFSFLTATQSRKRSGIW